MDIAKTADDRMILYATDGKIKKVGNVQVNSLKVRGSGQNSNSNESLSQPEEEVKQKQLDIIQNTNPAPNTYSTWIRSKEDILTWEEVLQLDDESIGQFVWGDFSRADAEQALKDGTITVYSSYPINNGTFVSTSYIQAQEYAGGKNGKVYSKTIPLSDVAWINGDEGQYAEIGAAQKNTTEGGGVIRWSISSNLEKEIDSVINGTLDASKNEVYLGETSNFLTDVIGAENLSLYMPASKVYSSIVTREEYDKKPYYAEQRNYHGMGKDDFIEVLEKSETPIAAFADRADEKGNKRQNRIVLVTDKLLTDIETGKTGYAVVVEEIESTARRQGKQFKANKTITVYPRTQLFSDITEAIVDGRILDITKKGEQLLAGRRGANAQATIQETVLKQNIANFWANVKWGKQKTVTSDSSSGFTTMKDAFQKAGYIDQDGHIQYMFESAKDSNPDENVNIESDNVAPAQNSLSNDGEQATKKYGDYAVSGEDIRLEAQDDIAPLPENAESGTEYPDDYAPISEELVENDTESDPEIESIIKTVKEQLQQKRNNYESERSSLEEKRQTSRDNLDNKIAEAQAKYDAKKNKDTRIANTLLRRVERLKTQKANIDADFKRCYRKFHRNRIPQKSLSI